MRIFPLRKNNRGFTVMELTLYMGLLLILLVILSQLFTATIESQLDSQRFSYVQQDGRFILNRLTYDIQRASSVAVPDTLGAQTSTLQLDINGVAYTYSLTDGNLLANGIRLNGHGTTVSDLTFQKLGNLNGKPTVTFGYTVTSLAETNGVPEVKSYQTTAGLR